ncbi:MAG: RsmE family RNA methyltransferase [Bacteroidota bacterium]
MEKRPKTTLFYHPDLSERYFQLDPDEAKHIKTLRIRTGDTIWLVDGKGTRAIGQVNSPAVKDCQIEVVEVLPPDPKPNYSIHIAVAPTKNNDRIEWFFEKAIEIGIDRLTLIETQNSVRVRLNGERLWRKGLAAMKQSLRAQMPRVESLIPFEEFIQSSEEEERFIAYTPQQESQMLQKVARAQKSYCVLVGPEGGFTEEEVALAEQKGFQRVGLGKTRLRTETAALTSCMYLNFLNS